MAANGGRMAARAAPELLANMRAALVPRGLRGEDDEPLVAGWAQGRSLVLAVGKVRGRYGDSWVVY